jgi:hypothetical protein
MKPRKSDRQRERQHAQLSKIETELKNTLDGVNALVDRTNRSMRVHDCATARLNFDQAALAFRDIGKKLKRADVLYRQLRIKPATLDEHKPSPTPAPALQPPVKSPPAKEKPAKRGGR